MSSPKRRKLHESKATLTLPQYGPITSHVGNDDGMRSFAKKVLEASRTSRVLALDGPTGCGKSSIVPATLMESDRDTSVYCLQPRRLAAQELAARVASLRRSTVGDVVGYCIGKEHQAGLATRLHFVTVDWFIAKMSSLDNLPNMTHLILDEVHEMTISMDMAMLVAWILLYQRSDLRVILMSATMNWGPLQQYFERFLDDQVEFPMKFETQSHSVKTYTLDFLRECLQDDDMTEKIDRLQGIMSHRSEILEETMAVCVRAIREIWKAGISVLVFLPGFYEMEAFGTLLQESVLQNPHIENAESEAFKVSIHFLRSNVPTQARSAAMSAPGPQEMKIILSTEIAQSSVTFCGLRYVFDFGLRRKLVASSLDGEDVMVTNWISLFSLKQRSGRAGRLAEGAYFLLVPSQVFCTFAEEDDMSFCETDLAELVLAICSMETGGISTWGSAEDVCRFLLHPPPADQIIRVLSLLQQERALDSSRHPTSFGRFLAAAHLPVRAAKMVFAGISLKASVDAIVLATAVVVRNLFKDCGTFSLTSCPKQILRQYSAQKFFDGEHYSDHLAFRNILLTYLTGQMRTDHAPLLDMNAVSTAMHSLQHLSEYVLRSFEVAPESKTVLKLLASNTAQRSLTVSKLVDSAGVGLSSPSASTLSLPVVLAAIHRDPCFLRMLVFLASSPLLVVSASAINYGTRQPSKVMDMSVQIANPHATLRTVGSMRQFLEEVAPGCVEDVKQHAETCLLVTGIQSACDNVSQLFLDRPGRHLQRAPYVSQAIKLLWASGPLTLPKCEDQHHLADTVNLPQAVIWKFLDHARTKCSVWTQNSNSPSRMLSTSDQVLGVSSSKLTLRRNGRNMVKASAGLMTIFPLEGAVFDAVALLMTLNGNYRVRFFSSDNPEYASSAEIRHAKCSSAEQTIVSFKPFLLHPAKLLQLLNSFRSGLRDYFMFSDGTFPAHCSNVVRRLKDVLVHHDLPDAGSTGHDIAVIPSQWVDKDAKAMLLESPISIWAYGTSTGKEWLMFDDIEDLPLNSQLNCVWSKDDFIDHVADSMTTSMKDKGPPPKFQFSYRESREEASSDMVLTYNGKQACQPRALVIPVVSTQGSQAFPNGEKVSPSNSKVLFHGTTFSYLPHIMREGVKGASGHSRLGAWGRETLKEALTWKMDPLLDRVPCVALKLCCHVDFIMGPNAKVGQAWTVKPDSPDSMPMCVIEEVYLCWPVSVEQVHRADEIRSMVNGCVDYMVSLKVLKAKDAHCYKSAAWGCIKERHLAWGRGGEKLLSPFCPKPQYSIGVLEFSLAIVRILRLVSQGSGGKNEINPLDLDLVEIPPIFRKWLRRHECGAYVETDFKGDATADCVWEKWAAQNPKYKKTSGEPWEQIFVELPSRQSSAS